MTYITIELIRQKSADHHHDTLTTLEELSLHQCHLERIDLIDRVCPNLKILYLQNNYISQIEHIRRLKSLEYLNLAMNNLTKISKEIRSLEKLKKLDLTLNFIDVENLEESIGNLKYCYHLKELYLTGNPCARVNGVTMNQSIPTDDNDTHNISHTDSAVSTSCIHSSTFQSYRLYVISQLCTYNQSNHHQQQQQPTKNDHSKHIIDDMDTDTPFTTPHLECLDGYPITHTDLIHGCSSSDKIQHYIHELHHCIEMKTEENIKKTQSERDDDHQMKPSSINTNEYTPESRLLQYKHELQLEKEQNMDEEKRLYDSGLTALTDHHLLNEAKNKLCQKVIVGGDGDHDSDDILPTQRNTGKYEWKWIEHIKTTKSHPQQNYDSNYVELHISLPKYMDTSCIEVDIHTKWLQVIVNGNHNLLLHIPYVNDYNHSSRGRGWCLRSIELCRVKRMSHTGELRVTLPLIYHHGHDEEMDAISCETGGNQAHLMGESSGSDEYSNVNHTKAPLCEHEHKNMKQNKCELSGAVDIHDIVKAKKIDDENSSDMDSKDMTYNILSRSRLLHNNHAISKSSRNNRVGKIHDTQPSTSHDHDEVDENELPPLE